MRYIMSIYVILGHISILTNIDIPLIGTSYIAVGGFFALSGFLLFSSFQKAPTISHYINRRARRILPPYILVVVLCTTLLWTVSDFPLHEYISSIETWRYLFANLSFLNFLQPTLPGIFSGQEFTMSAVNGSLWTMKGEWICYLTVPIIFFILTKHKHHNGLLLFLGIICVAIFCEWLLYELAENTHNNLYLLLAKQFGGLMVFFYIGALINHLLPMFIRFRWALFLLSIACALFQNYIPLYHLIFLPFSVSIITIFLSLVGSWGKPFNQYDNVSYDMYLFHFPIIQLFVYFGIPEMMPSWLLCISIIIVTYFAGMLSWNLLGKHILYPNSRIKEADG